MFAEIINRPVLKQRIRQKLKSAQVPAIMMTALYLSIMLILNLLDLVAGLGGEESLLTIFTGVLTTLVSVILMAGYYLYGMAIRRGERAEYLTLFDGFSRAGKLIALYFVTSFFIGLWSLLFVFPGIWAAYRYRFAVYNLLEDPDISVFEALNRSKRQTTGYKMQLFVYDMSYIGWSMLATLPMGILSAQTAFTVAEGVMQGSLAVPGAAVGIFPMLLAAIWSSVVQLFYLPQMTCGDLAYFDAAKRTSGIGPDSGPSDFDPPTIQRPTPPGPDNLGGYNHPDEF